MKKIIVFLLLTFVAYSSSAQLTKSEYLSTTIFPFDPGISTLSEVEKYMASGAYTLIKKTSSEDPTLDYKVKSKDFPHNTPRYFGIKWSNMFFSFSITGRLQALSLSSSFKDLSHCRSAFIKAKDFLNVEYHFCKKETNSDSGSFKEKERLTFNSDIAWYELFYGVDKTKGSQLILIIRPKYK